MTPTTPSTAQSLPGRSPQQRRQARGFSLIEVMIAALIMLVIALGLIPLFTSSMQSNVEGSEYTLVASHARERLELLWRLPFDSPELTLVAGTRLEVEEHYSQLQRAWVRGADHAQGDSALWRRTTTVEQFHVEELKDAQEENRPPNPLPFNAPSADVHVKRLTVNVRGPRQGGVLRGSKRLVIEAYKTL